jgi:hypothetical protein
MYYKELSSPIRLFSQTVASRLCCSTQNSTSIKSNVTTKYYIKTVLGTVAAETFSSMNL